MIRHVPGLGQETRRKKHSNTEKDLREDRKHSDKRERRDVQKAGNSVTVTHTIAFR
jgi:hypothetical protein